MAKGGFSDKDRAKALLGRKKLTLKEKTAIAAYIKSGNKLQSFKGAYNISPKNAESAAYRFFKKPKIVTALDKALKNSKFDDSYAVQTLKDIVEAGKTNFDITRPDTVLKALETYFKITGKVGPQGPKTSSTGPMVESQARNMNDKELRKAIKELDRKQARLLDILGEPEEGEIVE